jgi:photosystem II stability/assembly factor-like uncharacterized protein
MKKLFLVFCFLIMLSRITFSQWFWQNPPQWTHFWKVKFVSSTVGWIVGEAGTILKTTNGGTTWTAQTSGAGNNLYCVSFSDSNTGTVVGSYGKILRTTNGGATWTSQTNGTTLALYGVSFTDANTGTVVGGNGTILRTTNGGTTWTLQTSGTTNFLNGVSFTDINTGTAIGDLGTVLRTTNGGTTWTSQTSGTTKYLYGVSFTDANTGTVVGGNGTILRTTNGGTTWTLQTSGLTDFLHGVSFTDANTGTAVGGFGRILRTTNGGTTWTSQTSGATDFILTGVSFTDENTGTVVGVLGTILRTTNGGVPVELTSFEAHPEGNTVNLSWSTATELNNRGFEIERKVNDARVTLDFVSGHGTTSEKQNYFYLDNVSELDNGSIVNYRLKQIDFDGSFEYSNEIEVIINLTSGFSLSQNYPNPFNPSTIIKYSVASASFVTLKVYDVLGNEIAALVNEEKIPGIYTAEFNGAGLSSGVYFYRLSAGDRTDIKKMIMEK